MGIPATAVVIITCLTILAEVQTHEKSHDTDEGRVTSLEQFRENASTPSSRESTRTEHVNRSTMATTTRTASACPDDWVERANTRVCYFVSEEKVMWLKARDACIDMTSSLVSIHSQSENRFIHSIVNKTSDYWIGMTADSLRDGKWYDGTDVTWTKWFDVPPLYGAWCASLYSSISFSEGAWGAVVCNVGNPYVCKKELYNFGGDEDNAIFSWVLIGGLAAGAVLLVAAAVVAAKTDAIQVTKSRLLAVTPRRDTRTSRREMPLPPLPVTRAMSLPPLHDNPSFIAPNVHRQARPVESYNHSFHLPDTTIAATDGYEMPKRPSTPTDDEYSPTYLEILPSILDECLNRRIFESNEDISLYRNCSVTL